jgi:hypothetical protein
MGRKMGGKCEFQKTKLQTALDDLDNAQASLKGATGQELHNAAAAVNKATKDVTNAKTALSKCLGIFTPSAAPVPVRIEVDKLICYSETSGLGSDEIYILVMAVDLNATVPVLFNGAKFQIPIPAQRVTKIGTWTDVNDGTTRLSSELAAEDRRAFWNLNGSLQLIPDPNKVIILVGLMENDDADPNGVRSTDNGLMTGNLVSNLTLTRAQLVTSLINSMNGAMSAARLAGASFPFNGDDPIGSVQELTIDMGTLQDAYQDGSTSTTSLRFAGDDALYEVTFTISTT